VSSRARGTAATRTRLGLPAPEPLPPGVRIVLDARPLQEPDRAPVTATYLHELLCAFDASPLPGESFAILLQAGLPDPTDAFDSLDVVGRRQLPPTRRLGSGALTLDPFLLRGASLGTAWRASMGGAAGAVYHAVGGAVPLASGLPLVVTLLDLAPWELAAQFQRSPAARFGQRLRARILRDAAAVIVPSQAAARSARRLLHVPPDRLRVVPLAPRAAFAGTVDPTPGRLVRERLGVGERYLVYAGRYDARQDLVTLLRALGRLATKQAAPDLPRLLLVGATPDDRAALARAASREGVGDVLAYAPALDEEALASLVAAARAVVLPALSDAAGLSAMEAIAVGTPVVASSVGALPEIVGSAGILVEPRDPGRLATAQDAARSDETVHRGLAAAARARAASSHRTWADVALETRRVYADAGVRRRPDRPVAAAD
jgi:glycosyltransferase involved in cell wall biosynthesis